MTAGRVTVGLTRVFLGRAVSAPRSAARLTSVRSLVLSSQRPTTPEKPTDEVNRPIKFSTSKASQSTWKVQHAMGSQFQQPWWRVLPITFFGIGFLLWCVLREETDTDKQLEKHLYEQLPDLNISAQAKSEES